MKSFHKVSGKINSKGEFSYKSIHSLLEWFNENKNKDILVTFQLDDKTLSNDYLYRYKFHILPQVQQAFKESGENLSIIEVEEKMKPLCPILHDVKVIDGENVILFKDAKDLSNQEMKHYIDHIIRICAEDLNYIIND